MHWINNRRWAPIRYGIVKSAWLPNTDIEFNHLGPWPRLIFEPIFFEQLTGTTWLFAYRVHG